MATGRGIAAEAERSGELGRLGTRWDVVAVAALAGVLVSLNIGKVPPAITTLRESLGLGMVAAGWTASLVSVVAGLFGFAIGMLVDRTGARRALLVSLVMAGGGGMAGAAASGVPTLLAARAVEALGFVLVAISAPRLIIAATDPRDRGLALGIWGSYVPAGIAAAMLAAPALMEVAGWRGLWLANGVVILAFLLVAAPALRPARWPGQPPSGTALDLAGARRVLARPGPWLLGVCFGLYTATYHAFMVWLPTFLKEVLGYDVAGAAFLTALIVLSNVVGNVASAALMHARVARWVLMAVSFAAMAATAVGLYSDAVAGAPLRLAMAFAFSTLGGLAPSAVLAGVPHHAPSPALIATTSGIVVQLVNLGSLLGPPALAVAVGALGGWHTAHWPLAATALAGIALSFGLGALERRRRVST